MKANEFVKLRGISYCKGLLIKADGCAAIQAREDNSRVSVDDLKRLIEGHELVALFDDIDCAKAWVSDLDSDWPYQVKGADTKFFKWQLEQAIADVESCQ